MKLAKNEFTTSSLLRFLEDEYGTKLSGKHFNQSDIAQYCLRGNLPYRYGGNKLKIDYVENIKIITLL